MRNENNFDDLLNNIRQVSLPLGFAERVRNSIYRQVRKDKIIRIGLNLSLVLTVLSTIWSFRLLLVDISYSSLFPVLRLALSDSAQVLKFFTDWMYAVIDEIPFETFALALVNLFVLVLLVNILIRKSTGTLFTVFTMQQRRTLSE